MARTIRGGSDIAVSNVESRGGSGGHSRAVTHNPVLALRPTWIRDMFQAANSLPEVGLACRAHRGAKVILQHAGPTVLGTTMGLERAASSEGARALGTKKQRGTRLSDQRRQPIGLESQ
jgi:hypothetical protein